MAMMVCWNDGAATRCLSQVTRSQSSGYFCTLGDKTRSLRGVAHVALRTTHYQAITHGHDQDRTPRQSTSEAGNVHPDGPRLSMTVSLG